MFTLTGETFGIRYERDLLPLARTIPVVRLRLLLLKGLVDRFLWSIFCVDAIIRGGFRGPGPKCRRLGLIPRGLVLVPGFINAVE